MVRFFAELNDISGDTIRLGPDETAHIRSLRLRPDELFIVCDGAGTDCVCRLGTTAASGTGSGDTTSGDTGRSANGRGESSFAVILESHPSRGEPSVACTVYLALTKGDRLDYAVQKSIELGAYNFVLFPSGRCVCDPSDISKKVTRLQRIALETAKQCGRGRVPSVSAQTSFRAAVNAASGAGDGLSLFLYEDEKNLHIKQALEQHYIGGPVSIMTGPEGGFEPHEVELAASAGMLRVSLGPRILRCETAPAAALAALMFFTDNL